MESKKKGRVCCIDFISTRCFCYSSAKMRMYVCVFDRAVAHFGWKECPSNKLSENAKRKRFG